MLFFCSGRFLNDFYHQITYDSFKDRDDEAVLCILEEINR